MDFALLFDGRRCFCGWGRVSKSSEQQNNAFWVNDFFLEEAEPWKTFTHFEVSERIPAHFLEKLPAAREWKLPAHEAFGGLWQKATAAFSHSENLPLKKIVLALSDKAEAVKPSNLQGSLEQFLSQRKGYFYAFSLGDQSAWGFTPELLFRAEENALETMALAGTFATHPQANEALAAKRPSLRPEHEWVLQYLRDFAEARGARLLLSAEESLAQGSLSHLLTRVRFENLKTDDLHALIAGFHPTPALGVYPKNAATLRLLREVRAGLPGYYGAPFGVVCDEAKFFVVLIRGYFFDSKVLRRTIGVGVTRDSDFAGEWRELQLKRTSMEELWAG